MKNLQFPSSAQIIPLSDLKVEAGVITSPLPILSYSIQADKLGYLLTTELSADKTKIAYYAYNITTREKDKSFSAVSGFVICDR